MVIVVTRRVPMTRGAALRSRVKGNVQARFWNSGGRGDSPADCSKLSEPFMSPWASLYGSLCWDWRVVNRAVQRVVKALGSLSNSCEPVYPEAGVPQPGPGGGSL